MTSDSRGAEGLAAAEPARPEASAARGRAGACVGRHRLMLGFMLLALAVSCGGRLALRTFWPELAVACRYTCGAPAAIPDAMDTARLGVLEPSVSIRGAGAINSQG